jgi:hypothetical protein
MRQHTFVRFACCIVGWTIVYSTFSVLQNPSRPSKVYVQPFLREKGPRCAADFPHPSTTEVKERIEQHLHSSVSSWHVIGWTPLYTDVIGIGHVMTLGVSCWFLTTGDQVLSQTCSCGICSGQSVNRTGFPRIFRVSPINIISRKLQVPSALTDRALP